MKTTSQLREMRESSDDELRSRLARLEEELFGLRMKRYTNRLDNTSQIREVRREIARLVTIVHNRAQGRERHGDAAESQE